MPFLASRVIEARKSLGEHVSQGRFSRMIADNLDRYVSEATVKGWESGRCVPSQKLFDALVSVTGKPYSFFYGEDVGCKKTNPPKQSPRKRAKAKKQGAVA